MRLLAVTSLLILPIIIISEAGQVFDDECVDSSDFVSNGTCYEFAQNSSVLSYENASNYCLSRGKTLISLTSVDQMNFISKRLRKLNWQHVLVDLKFTRTGWNWIDTNVPLRGQGCSQTTYSDESGLVNMVSTSMTVERCTNFCSRNRKLFAAVEDGVFCYCSREHIWSRPAHNCSLPCPGAAEQKCGGYFSSLSFFSADFAYDNWLNGRPSIHGICAAIKIDRMLNSWVDYGCSMVQPFICIMDYATVKSRDRMKDAEDYSCGSGVCYFLFSAIQNTWLNADRHCIRNGGRLATIDGQIHQDTVSRLLHGSSLKSGTLVWIGAVSHQWLQHDVDGTLQELPYDFWISSMEPVAPESYPCAAVVVTDRGRAGLQSRSCDFLGDIFNRFICTSNAISSYQPTEATTSSTEAAEDEEQTTTTTTATTMGDDGVTTEAAPFVKMAKMSVRVHNTMSSATTSSSTTTTTETTTVEVTTTVQIYDVTDVFVEDNSTVETTVRPFETSTQEELTSTEDCQETTTFAQDETSSENPEECTTLLATTEETTAIVTEENETSVAYVRPLNKFPETTTSVETLGTTTVPTLETTLTDVVTETAETTTVTVTTDVTTVPELTTTTESVTTTTLSPTTVTVSTTAEAFNVTAAGIAELLCSATCRNLSRTADGVTYDVAECYMPFNHSRDGWYDKIGVPCSELLPERQLETTTTTLYLEPASMLLLNLPWWVIFIISIAGILIAGGVVAVVVLFSKSCRNGSRTRPVGSASSCNSSVNNRVAPDVATPTPTETAVLFRKK